MAELSTLGDVIKTAYEGEANTNAFTDAFQSKLIGIEAGAEVNTVSPGDIPTTPADIGAATAAQGALAASAVQPGDIGTAAAEDVGAFATAAQGALAESAVQPGDLGTAAAQDVGAFATAAQGTLADTALQSIPVGV